MGLSVMLRPGDFVGEVARGFLVSAEMMRVRRRRIRRGEFGKSPKNACRLDDRMLDSEQFSDSCLHFPLSMFRKPGRMLSFSGADVITLSPGGEVD